MRVSIIGCFFAILILSSSTVVAKYFVVRASSHQATAHIEDLPEQFGSWKVSARHDLELKYRDILGLDSYLKREYKSEDGRFVYVYVGYWKTQTGDFQAAKHSPQVCLPSNGWKISQLQSNVIDLGLKKELQVSSLLGTVERKNIFFNYWFFAGHHTYHQDWKALAIISFERLLYGRSDGGIVEISTELDPNKFLDVAVKDSQKTLDEFTKLMWPELEKLASM